MKRNLPLDLYGGMSNCSKFKYNNKKIYRVVFSDALEFYKFRLMVTVKESR